MPIPKSEPAPQPVPSIAPPSAGATPKGDNPTAKPESKQGAVQTNTTNRLPAEGSDPKLTDPGRSDESGRPVANRIMNFRAEDVSAAELRITVDYQYAGDLGASFISGSLRAGRASFPGPFAHEVVHIQAGSGTASFTITKFQADPASVTTDEVEVCFTRGKTRTPMPTPSSRMVCETFQYTKTWSGFLPFQ
jgi:hypothetical protein